MYDVEEGDSGLASSFAASFQNSKKNGLTVLITPSHSQPYGISDAISLMESFFSDPNVDIISPQLYSSGLETQNDFTAVGTPWTAYAKSKAKIVPALTYASLYEDARQHFQQDGVSLSGFVIWPKIN